MIQVVNFWNKMYINFVAPKLTIFKLDKVKTNIDNVYVEEQFSRIFLPPFTIRGFHLDNTWKQLLGGLMPFREEEDNIQFVINFENMVQIIRGLKYSHLSEMTITYSGNGIPTAYKSSSLLILKVNGNVVGSFDCGNLAYNTTLKLGNAINTLTNFSVILTGSNDSSINLVDFNEINFKNSNLMIYSFNHSYQNLSDVIEYGDLILTNKWRLYEVLNAAPGGDFGWDWVTYVLSCNLAKIDQCILPGDYVQQIKAHQFNLPRINKE